MSSGFVTESELTEAREKRQAEWEKVRQPDQPMGKLFGTDERHCSTAVHMYDLHFLWILQKCQKNHTIRVRCTIVWKSKKTKKTWISKNHIS